MKIYIDLLPKEKKIELKREKLFRTILREELLFLFPIFLFIVILLNIYYLLSIQRDFSMVAKSQAESQNKYQEIASYEEKFKKANDYSEKLLKIQAGHLYWMEIFNKLSAITPDGVSISDFSSKDFKIFLVGKAKNRDMLLVFKSNLENNSCFASVNVPLSNLVVKEDVDFQIDISINQDCLKKQ